MIDKTTLTPFERRLVADLERYVGGITDPTPSTAVAARAMASPRRPWFGLDLRVVRIAVAVGLLILAVVAAMLVGAERRPAFGAWVLNLGCGSDLACPEGEAVWITRPGEDAHRELFADLPVRMRHATWTADGRSVIATDQLDLYLSGLFGPSRMIKACTAPCVGIDEPAVSPDGSMLAYTVSTGPVTAFGTVERDYAGSMQLVVAPLRADGSLGDPRVLTETHASPETGANQIYGPRWSPDSRSLVFWEDRIDTDGHATGAALFTVALDHERPRQMTDWAAFAGDADWSPDGASIVYSTYPASIASPADRGVSNLWVMPSAGGVSVELTHSRTRVTARCSRATGRTARSSTSSPSRDRRRSISWTRRPARTRRS